MVCIRCSPLLRQDRPCHLKTTFTSPPEHPLAAPRSFRLLPIRSVRRKPAEAFVKRRGGFSPYEILKDQFQRQWKTLRDLVSDLPDEQWKTGEIFHLVPARLIYHILAGTEVYARSTSYEEYKSRQIFTLDWEVAPSEELPARNKTIAHIENMQKAVGAWLESLGDEGLVESDEGFEWAGSRKIGRAVYLLRHTQNHIGELNSELRRRGLSRGKWA
jgi:hypothetical protein